MDTLRKTGKYPAQSYYKKAETTRIKNYRPISLLPFLFKIWERLLEKRLRVSLELGGHLSKLQMGSRTALGTSHAIICSQLIFERAKKQEYNIYVAHADLSKAYNRVKRNKLWKKVRSKSSTKIAEAIESTYANHAEFIKIGDSNSETSSLQNGVRQGSVLFPLIFILYVNEVLEDLITTKLGCEMDGFEHRISGICLLTTYNYLRHR